MCYEKSVICCVVFCLHVIIDAGCLVSTMFASTAVVPSSEWWLRSLFLKDENEITFLSSHVIEAHN